MGYVHIDMGDVSCTHGSELCTHGSGLCTLASWWGIHTRGSVEGLYTHVSERRNKGHSRVRPVMDMGQLEVGFALNGYG